MKNLSESKTPINRHINHKNIYKNKLKEDNDSIPKNINKKSFRTSAKATKINYRNKNNEDFFSRTQYEKDESKKANNSLIYTKNKDKNINNNQSFKKYNKNENMRDIKKEYSLCQKEIISLKNKEEEIKKLRNQLKLKKENYDIYMNRNISFTNSNSKYKKNIKSNWSKKLSYKESKTKNEKSRKNYSVIAGINSDNKILNNLKIHNTHKNNKTRSKSNSNSNDKIKNKKRTINKNLFNNINHNNKKNVNKTTINTDRNYNDDDNDNEINKNNSNNRVYKKPKQNNVIRINKYCPYHDSFKNNIFNKNNTVSNSHKKIINYSKKKNKIVKRNKSINNNSAINSENKSKTFNNFFGSNNKNEENKKEKQKCEKKEKTVKKEKQNKDATEKKEQKLKEQKEQNVKEEKVEKEQKNEKDEKVDEEEKNNKDKKVEKNEKEIISDEDKNEIKNISDDNEIKIKSIDQVGIITKAGEEDTGEEKINQDNYFNYDLCNGYKFIGVCDGHGEDGQNVSEYLRNTLPEELEKELKKLISNENKRLSILESILQKNRNELLNFEEKSKDNDNNDKKKEKVNLIENLENFQKMNDLFKKVYIETNSRLIEENYMFNLENSGSTCIGLFLQHKKINKVYTANVGDSRAILIKESINKNNDNNNSWSYVQLSRDHKPSEKDEAERILKYGGEIQQLQNEDGEFEGPYRIYMKDDEGPGLAMSRSFGDAIGSILGVIAIPEVKEYTIEKEDKAIIIASDGLWEYVSNEEVTDIVKNLIEKNDVNIIVNELYKYSYEKWKMKDSGIDDITIICVLLK